MAEDIMNEIAADMLSIPPLVFRIVRKKIIKTTLEEVGLNIKFPHFEILRLLDRGGTMHVAQIGEQLEIAKAQMTHLIDRLVEFGLVERDTDATDRRTINVALTAKGKQYITEHGCSMVNAVREKMSCLSEAELEELCNSLRNVRDTLLKLEA